MDLLKELYREHCERYFQPSPAYKKQQQKVAQLREQMAQAMGTAFEELLYTEEAILQEESEFSAYRQGIRLGASIILELLER